MKHFLLILSHMRTPVSNFYLAAFLLSAISIVYELLLGQTLSAFFGNTVLRYSVTIGLYLASLGIGAFLAERKFAQNPLKSLLQIELILSALGGGAIIFLFLLNSLISASFLFFITVHALIIIIGILSGLELPLLIRLCAREKASARILGISYAGAFVGSLLFAFLFYPIIGLTATALYVGTLNGIIALALGVTRLRERAYRMVFEIQALVVILLLWGLYFAAEINEYALSLYLN